MARESITAVQGPVHHSWSLVQAFMDTCPDNIWAENRGGWPVWQQIAHTLAVLDFFILGEDEAPLPGPCDMSTLMLKVQGACLVSKQDMKHYAEAVKVRLDAWLGALNDDDLPRLHTALSKKLGRDMAYGTAVAMLTGHTLYHLGCCDTVLREHGLPGVF